MKFLLLLPLLFLLMGFRYPEANYPQFQSGDCVLFMDQPGRPDKSMIVRVEGFENGKYLYRWWLFQHEWSVELGKVLVKQSMFERLFKKVGCPDNLT